MTARELLSVVLRRWYVIVLGAVVSVGALSVVWSQPGVYFTRFDVVLLAPTNVDFPNNIQDPHFALAPMAGLLVADVTNGKLPTPMGSTDTTLYGEGVRQGWRIRLPNTGSQWRPMYDEPRIDVQVVDRDPETVAQEAHRLRSALRARLDARQEELGISPQMRITMIASPVDPVISHVGGSRSRAALVLALVGASLTTFGAVLLEKFLGFRRSRRAAATKVYKQPSFS